MADGHSLCGLYVSPSVERFFTLFRMEQRRQRRGFLIREKIALYTLKAEDLGFRPMQRARTAKKPPLAAKYQNSKTGETWSGHGRAPKWISGKPKEKFLISQ